MVMRVLFGVWLVAGALAAVDVQDLPGDEPSLFEVDQVPAARLPGLVHSSIVGTPRAVAPRPVTSGVEGGASYRKRLLVRVAVR